LKVSENKRKGDVPLKMIDVSESKPGHSCPIRTAMLTGRFAQVGAATVIGSTAVPQYPQASAPFQRDPVPDEPPLGFDNSP
jgi:hypothetical protein